MKEREPETKRSERRENERQTTISATLGGLGKALSLREHSCSLLSLLAESETRERNKDDSKTAKTSEMHDHGSQQTGKKSRSTQPVVMILIE